MKKNKHHQGWRDSCSWTVPGLNLLTSRSFDLCHRDNMRVSESTNFVLMCSDDRFCVATPITQWMSIPSMGLWVHLWTLAPRETMANTSHTSQKDPEGRSWSPSGRMWWWDIVWHNHTNKDQEHSRTTRPVHTHLWQWESLINRWWIVDESLMNRWWIVDV